MRSNSSGSAQAASAEAITQLQPRPRALALSFFNSVSRPDMASGGGETSGTGGVGRSGSCPSCLAAATNGTDGAAQRRSPVGVQQGCCACCCRRTVGAAVARGRTAPPGVSCHARHKQKFQKRNLQPGLSWRGDPVEHGLVGQDTATSAAFVGRSALSQRQRCHMGGTRIPMDGGEWSPLLHLVHYTFKSWCRWAAGRTG